jgi:hypothetical protein
MTENINEKITDLLNENNNDQTTESTELTTENNIQQPTENNTQFASFINQYVTINGNSPERTNGILLGVGKEHIALLTDTGIVYYQSRHIKGITKQQKKFHFFAKLANLDYEVVKVHGFKDVVRAFQHKWVILNGRKKDSLEGFISEVYDDHVIMINGGDVFYVPLYHIKSITEAVKNENNSDENKDENNHDNKNKNKQKKKKNDHSEEDPASSDGREKVLVKSSQVFSAYKNNID